MIKVSIGKARVLSETEKNALLSALPKKSAERLGQKKDPDIRDLSFYAYYLLSDTVGAELFRKARLSFEDSGRPFFEGIDCDISLSHAEGYAACAVSDRRSVRVGVDIENSRLGIEKMEGISSRFFSSAERKLLSEAEDKSYTFLEIWTKKEALKKCLAKISDPTVLPDTESADGFRFITRRIDDTAVISVCFPKSAETVEFNIK